MGVVLHHVDEHELADLGERLYRAFAIAGLTAHELDEAVAAAMTGALEIIEKGRARDEKRRASINVVR